MMADPRGGLGRFARNGNSAARTYGAGIRPPTREPGPARAAAGGVGVRARAGVKSVAGGRTDVTGSAVTASAATTGASASASASGPASGDRGDDSGDPDAEDPGDLADGRARTASRQCAVRRAVLLGFAVSGAALLVGCGDDAGDPSSQAGGAGQTSASPSSPPSTEPSLEPFPGADDGGNGDGNATGLVKTDEVPVGGAVLAGDYLVAQPQRGVFKAFDATCPHQGITVDPPIGTNDYFMCPGHNSKFRLSDGSRISGPAPRGLKPVAVTVRNGYVVEA
jgi:nitrite reductase/ring-hydroxylating ferredoxin subunit